MEHIEEVTLTDAELREADEYAARANREAAARNAQTRLPGVNKNPQSASTLGFRAQRAFTKYLGAPWSPRDARNGPNVGSLFKVRGRQRYCGNPQPELEVRPYDRDDLVFVHVVTDDSVRFTIKGWISGRDAKKFPLKDFGGIGRQAYSVPSESLNPTAGLPHDLALQQGSPHQACGLKVA